MNTPQDTSTSLHDPSTPTIARMVDTAGRDGPTTPREVASQLQSGGFFWLDLENQDGADELAEFGQSLQLSAAAIDSLTHASQRSSFALAAGSVQAVLPAAAGVRPAAWLEANYVTLLLTEQFLLTVHATPSPALQHARHQYRGLDDEDARADEVRLLFLVTDILIGSFRPQLLAIDDRLGEIQVGMLRSVSPDVHDELVKILGILTDAIQEFGWYVHDLEDIAEMVDGLPGLRPDAQQHFDRHRRRVSRMQENARNIREQAKDALSHYSEVVAGRQAQVINSLTIVATVFLPLSFLTGYFGMNFRILTADAQNTLWQFILLGLLLPIGSAALSLLLIRRLERRLGIGHMEEPPS
jgi:Mg2+ and Co2+ transporter CorA